MIWNDYKNENETLEIKKKPCEMGSEELSKVAGGVNYPPSSANLDPRTDYKPKPMYACTCAS